MNVQPPVGRQATRLVTGAHSYFFLMLWQSRDGLKEADWDIDFALSWVPQALKFLYSPLSPSGACCYRNLAGWFNCLHWDENTFRLFPCWRRASQKVFLVTWDLDNTGRRHSQSLCSLSCRTAFPLSQKLWTQLETVPTEQQHRETPTGICCFFRKDKPRV